MYYPLNPEAMYLSFPERIKTERDLYQFLTSMILLLGHRFNPYDHVRLYVKEEDCETPMFDGCRAVVAERLREESLDFCQRNGFEIQEKTYDVFELALAV